MFVYSYSVLGWCKNNCNFTWLNFAIWYWNTFLSKCGYVIYHFNVHFMLYVFLLMTYYLLFILYLDYRNDIRQKAPLSDFFFLFKFKMGCKAVEATWNISDAFGSGTVNERIVQWLFKKFCKGDECCEAQWPAIRSWQQPIKTNHRS